jgi:CHASE2 domain-containing sensor protein/tRNA A-37 threonylcarbamoyl transferase component Bud32
LTQHSERTKSRSPNEPQNTTFEQSQRPAFSKKLWSRLKGSGAAIFRNPALLTSLAVTGLLLGARQVGILEPLELAAFDQLVRLEPIQPPDPRILVVTITEEDLQSQGKWPLSDAVYEQLLSKLEQYEAKVIGLDIYRDLVLEPGHADLSKRLQQQSNIVTVCNFTTNNDAGVPPPKTAPLPQVGFSNIPVDRDAVVRKALLFADPAPNAVCPTSTSFSFQIAQKYLEDQGISPQLTEQEYVQLGQAVFKPLEANTGGYQKADSRGYQILLDYRSPSAIARTVTLSDVFSDRLDPSWVKDRIVIIGSTAQSLRDNFYTPYSGRSQRYDKMPGVIVHAQVVSHLLSTALDGKTPFGFWPEWLEALGIWGWSLTGGILAFRLRHPIRLLLGEVTALSLLLGSSWILFLNAAWVPVATPLIGLLASSAGVVAYFKYKEQQDHADIVEKVKEQERNLALLQALLKETTEVAPEATGLSTIEQTGMSSDDATAILTESQQLTLTKPSYHLLAGRYKSLSVLGSGGFGLTYMAEDTQRPGSPTCVIKHLKPARRDERFLQIARRLFRVEAEILEKLGNHSQIPHLLAYFEEKKEFYLVEEFVDGHSISDELPVDKRLPQEQVMQLVQDVLEILLFIHSHNVIHRDIKPTNMIRRASDHRVVLIDFGAVKQMQPQESSNPEEEYTVAVGTRGYAPPEQYAGHPNFSSDLYALGMIGIQALTGIHPQHLPRIANTGELNWRHLTSAQDKFLDILEKMVHYHFADRYQSATAVLEELLRI